MLERMHSQSFVAVNSFPATAEPGRGTRFCWAAEATKQHEESKEKNSADSGSKPMCKDFVASGKAIQVPEGVNRVEVLTPGRAGMAVEWECGKACARMTIELKNFSALFRLDFPRLIPGADAESYTVRMKVIGAP